MRCGKCCIPRGISEEGQRSFELAYRLYGNTSLSHRPLKMKINMGEKSPTLRVLPINVNTIKTQIKDQFRRRPSKVISSGLCARWLGKVG